MPFAKWEDMKQMKRLTNQDKKKIIMRSLPVVILAAIAFISAPSLLPESTDGMKRSVVMIECRERYEITVDGKTVAYFNDLKEDTTLDFVKDKADSDTEHKVMVCGCWINHLSFIPSCRGRIYTVNPFYGEKDLLAIGNANIDTVIGKTISRAEEMLKTHKMRCDELDYYLNTHSVKDEGYNTMAAYADENRRRKESLDKGLNILKGIRGKKNIRLTKKRSYVLLYSEDGKSVGRIMCHPLDDESRNVAKSTIILQTQDHFMPEGVNSVYRFDVFCLIPEKGDSITAAGIFGLNAMSTQAKALQKANVFKGRTTSLDTHDIPPLLAPEGSPLFNRNGFFIGITCKGGIKR